MAAAAARERKIMVAVDQSEESMCALRWCLDNLVVSSTDTLILLHAKSPPPAAYPSPLHATGAVAGLMFSTAGIERYCNDAAESVIRNAKKMCGSDLQIEAIIAEGDAREVICDMADKHKPHLLVVGSHGYGAIKRAFLGSVSNHCAQNANCPVLIVKKPK